MKLAFALDVSRASLAVGNARASCARIACPSSNVKIGRRWKEYQGADNWQGLLDPLDGSLCSEIVRYGEFVRAAYACFDSDPSSPTYSLCKHSRHSLLHHCGFGGCGYRVTRNLHATSGIRLPQWAGPKSSWIGYVAVCHDENEIARLGRRDIVVAFRGTVTALEWLENLRATLTHLPSTAASGAAASREPRVERGFWSLFTNPGPTQPSLRDALRDEVKRLLATYAGAGSNADGRPVSLTIVGHSLGAALAVLAAYDVASEFDGRGLTVTAVTFGGPRVGNAAFRRRLEEKGSKVLRIVNSHDIVTKVPGFVVDGVGGGGGGGGGGDGVVPEWWGYADVGCELRLHGRPTVNVAACHDLDVYLELVNEMNKSPCELPVKSASWRPFLTVGA